MDDRLDIRDEQINKMISSKEKIYDRYPRCIDILDTQNQQIGYISQIPRYDIYPR